MYVLYVCVCIYSVQFSSLLTLTHTHTHTHSHTHSRSQDHVQLQSARDRYQLVSESVLPVINIFYLQLQLLQKIQEGQKVVARAMEAAGSQTHLEGLLTDINVSHMIVT